MGPDWEPLPIVWPSVLREWFWRMKTAGTVQNPVSIQMANVPKIWATHTRSENDRRFRYMKYYLLPTPRALSVVNRNLRGRAWRTPPPEIISRPLTDMIFR